MTQNSKLTISIDGYLVGSLYWPIGTEAYKPFGANLTQEAQRIAGGERPTLREIVELVMSENDGDFGGGATIAQGQLCAMRETFTQGRKTTTARRWPLSAFPSLADYCHPDPDWLPCDPNDEDY